jgi:biofilm PGA synthesis N-glycosyltransferase PgaC
MIAFLTVLLIVIHLGYFAYISILRLAWKRTITIPSTLIHKDLKLSLVIPARNEENTILLLLNDLQNQRFPKNKFEVIVVDDASTDQTAANVLEFQKVAQFPLQLIHLKDDQGLNIYKKRAIEKGIFHAQNPIIVTTDADCRVGQLWLELIANAFILGNCNMVLGPVKFKYQTGFFQAFQQMEFSSLIAVTCATAKLGHPLMCNGANLAYKKDSFFEVGGYGNDTFASGDDMFLLHKMQEKFPSNIHFIQNREAMVETISKQDFPEFLGQRKRWVSKNRFLPDWKTILVGALTYATSVSLLIYFFLACFSPQNLWTPMLLCLSLKASGDYLFLLSIKKFFGLEKALTYYLPCLFANIFYTSLILPYSSLGGKYTWKGRKLK